MIESYNYNLSYFADGRPVPDLLTEEQLVEFLHISEVTEAEDHHNVIKNLIRMRDLPRIQICKKLLFPKKAILEWIEQETIKS